NLDPEQTVVVSGIGCSSRLPGFVQAYGFHGVHGRALPIATGIKAARPELNVVVVGGDGDGYSIGAGHLPHCARRNPDITYLVMNNNTYGLTKGQVSPTSMVPLASLNAKIDSKRRQRDHRGRRLLCCPRLQLQTEPTGGAASHWHQ